MQAYMKHAIAQQDLQGVVRTAMLPYTITIRIRHLTEGWLSRQSHDLQLEGLHVCAYASIYLLLYDSQVCTSSYLCDPQVQASSSL